jgi:chromosome segregation ATPase
MFGKKGKKTIFDYITAHEPYNSIEDLHRPNYLEGTVSVEHKELETDIEEYWGLLHPLVNDFINSYALVYDKMGKEVGEAREQLESARRSLTFEQQNVQEMADKHREIKGELQNEIVKRRDLEERLKDEREMITSQFNQEKRSLEIIAETKLAEGVKLDDVLGEVSKSVAGSEEVSRLNQKVAELEDKIKQEREENERIQGELSTSFMEKITRYDEMIQNLKARLGEE